jgi:hypothetical protein
MDRRSSNVRRKKIMGATKKWSEGLKKEIDKTHIDLYQQAMRYMGVKYLTKKYPNDAELGKAVRKYLVDQDLLNDK